MTTALYRRYRPESFADVIGQEHVTGPLMQALRSGRVHHAYLFSGPRGCGKTTSARILARCLNCEQGPTPDPCGVCESCLALARGGPGSVDVIEIDAASHGGVDDARDLRERAAFGPAQARYKVYIIDEAHMVTTNGFNALLKVVEEPPPHVKFIFATTEPDKVLATIRSRTHHYPFHLVPPQRLSTYLEELCGQEGVALEPGVLSFVTRAGGGSVRDSLSVLDQLISGAGEEGLTYERTAALLGFTDVELLDGIVDAVAARDAATAFAQVGRVMESGHDPRRFVEDLLERYRDLIVLTAVGDDAPAAGLLPGLPADQIDRMRHQSAVQGPEALSRAADVVSRGLSEMSGAVSSRLLLELLVARLLLPAASGEDGYGARLDRLERRLGATEGGGTAARPGPSPGTPVQPPHAAAPHPVGPSTGAPQGVPSGGPAHGSGAPAAAEVEAADPSPGALDTAALRRQWPDVLERVRTISRRTWSGLQKAVLLDYDGRRVLLGMPDENWMRHFMGTAHEETLRQALIESVALETRIEATVAGEPPATSRTPATEDPAGPASGPTSDPTGPTPVDDPAAAPSAGPPDGPPDGPPLGRIRTRAAPSGSGPQDSLAGHQVHRTAPVPASGPTSRAAAGATTVPAPDGGPSMAEQLGVVGRGPATGGGPDWGRRSGAGSAPAWASAEPTTSDDGGDGDADRAAERATVQARVAPTVPRVRSRTGTDQAGAADNPAAGGQAGLGRDVPPDGVGDAPSVDDEDLAGSRVVGQPVIESVLGGTVIAINDDPVG